MNPSETTTTQYLTFSVAGEEYGVSVLDVREILEYGVVTRIPGAPAYVRGVMNLRGRVIPLVDLAVRLGLPASAPTAKTCVVVVETHVRGELSVTGLVADSVSQVVDLASDDIEPKPAFGSAIDADFLSAMGRIGKRFVLLLDLDRVLADGSERTATPTRPSVPRSTVSASRTPAALALSLLLVGVAPRAFSQEPIKDNSFLIEEAYNQERGIVQHISTFSRATGSGDFVYTFTQEWPVKDAHHQLSFTLPVLGIDRGAGRDTAFGDVALNYRYQAAGVDGGAVAFAPRLSLLIPSGDSARGFGAGGVGVQVNLPISWEHSSRVVTHWNVGVTRSIRARNRDGQKASGTGYSLGQSFVFLAAPRVNLLVETLWTRTAEVTGPGITTGANALYVSPGIRWSHDFKNGLQIVPGLAFPIGIGPSRGDHAVFAYLSFEHPFRKSR